LREKAKAEKKRNRRIPQELARKMGLWLMEAGPNICRRAAARQLGVSERTLRNWERGAQEALKPLGRPAVSSGQRFKAYLQVARALRQQGSQAGWRPVLEKVKPFVSTRLVQEGLRALKKRRRLKLSKKICANRIHVEVLSPNVIWAQDSAHVGRTSKEEVKAEVIKDRGTLGYIGLAVGPSATSDEILDMLEAQKRGRGLPLVWATDNGSAYKSEKVAEYLRCEKVVHLLSRPRTPQDNGSAENGIRELKEDTGLGKGVKLSGPVEAAQKLAVSWYILDHGRPRASKGYRTAEELEVQLPSWRERVTRVAFYEQACGSMEKAVKGGGTARQKRQDQREAVYETLERYQLISRTRGGKPFKLVQQKPEDIL
jgi:transposase InsO family protein